jgi:hypothetical protein
VTERKPLQWERERDGWRAWIAKHEDRQAGCSVRIHGHEPALLVASWYVVVIARQQYSQGNTAAVELRASCSSTHENIKHAVDRAEREMYALLDATLARAERVLEAAVLGVQSDDADGAAVTRTANG